MSFIMIKQLTRFISFFSRSDSDENRYGCHTSSIIREKNEKYSCHFELNSVEYNGKMYPGILQ